MFISPSFQLPCVPFTCIVRFSSLSSQPFLLTGCVFPRGQGRELEDMGYATEARHIDSRHTHGSELSEPSQVSTSSGAIFRTKSIRSTTNRGDGGSDLSGRTRAQSMGTTDDGVSVSYRQGTRVTERASSSGSRALGKSSSVKHSHKFEL
jgi:hypothetical protein